MIATNHQAEQNFLVFGSRNIYRYTNWKGETTLRSFVPLCLRFGQTEYHKEDQWLVEVFDLDKRDFRTYALKDIQPR